MDIRPELSKNLDVNGFRGHYYLKEELVSFCRREGLCATGGKLELTERIATYLSTGRREKGRCTSPSRRRQTCSGDVITSDTLIGDGFICSEKHREFFKREIGAGFSFNVGFQRWLKANADKTCGDAIVAYRRILAEKSISPPPIGRQFEYNTYIRDFFADNPGLPLEAAIHCWRYKKMKTGDHRYEPEDLVALNRHDQAVRTSPD